MGSTKTYSRNELDFQKFCKRRCAVQIFQGCFFFFQNNPWVDVFFFPFGQDTAAEEEFAERAGAQIHGGIWWQLTSFIAFLVCLL